MKMIEWNTLKLDLKKLFNFQDEKDYLSKLVANFEKLEQKGENIPFKITGIRRKGFVIKVCRIIWFYFF